MNYKNSKNGQHIFTNNVCNYGKLSLCDNFTQTISIVRFFSSFGTNKYSVAYWELLSACFSAFHFRLFRVSKSEINYFSLRPLASKLQQQYLRSVWYAARNRAQEERQWNCMAHSLPRNQGLFYTLQCTQCKRDNADKMRCIPHWHGCLLCF